MDAAKLPFSVFRRAGRRFYYVAFKNEKTGDYLPAISTRQETEAGAVSIAFQWLKDGIPTVSSTSVRTSFSIIFLRLGKEKFRNIACSPYQA